MNHGYGDQGQLWVLIMAARVELPLGLSLVSVSFILLLREIGEKSERKSQGVPTMKVKE